MKIFLILLSVVALRPTWAQEEKECHCGLFVTTPLGEEEVHRLPPIEVESCEDVEACKAGCTEEWDTIFDKDGLDTIVPGHDHSIGEECCQNLAEHGHKDFRAHELFGYFSLCGGPWIFEGEHSGKDELCCEHGHFPDHC